MADFAALARNLLTLEINTVEKDGMSGQKMPTGPNALVETVVAYWDFLCRKSNDFAPQGNELPTWLRLISMSFDWGVEPYPPPAVEDGRAVALLAAARARNGKAASGDPAPRPFKDGLLRDAPGEVTEEVLDDLREVAFWMVEMRSRIQSLADGRSDLFAALRETVQEDVAADVIRIAARAFRAQERSIFHRIRRNCDQFKAIFRGDKAPERITRNSSEDDISATDLVPLRKAWDIGTEVILMQTVIQIDGDVVSRFQQGLEGEERQQLQLLHANAVDISFKYWRWLIDAVGKIAGQTVSSLLRGGA